MTTTYGSPTKLSKKSERALILQLLYTIEFKEKGTRISSIIEDYFTEYKILIEQDGEIVKTITEITRLKDELEEEIVPHLENWKINRLSAMVRLILRYAIWELKIKQEDHPLVINEAIELSRDFAEADSYRFVNGILDKWVKNNAKNYN
jgi:transcription antitermination protein NusB